MIDNSLKHMIIFKNHNTTDPPSITTQFLFLPEWSQWTTWSETWEECRGETEGEPGSNVMRMMMILS